MAWSAPMTWVPETSISAANLNLFVRDNLLETEVAKATGAGQLLVSAGNNEVAMRSKGGQLVTPQVTTTSTTPTTLSGGPSFSVTHGGNMLVLWAAEMQMTAGTGGTVSYMYCGPSITGQAGASTSRAIAHSATNNALVRYAGQTILTGMTPGTHTVEMVYWRSNVTSFTAGFANRELAVIPF